MRYTDTEMSHNFKQIDDGYEQCETCGFLNIGYTHKISVRSEMFIGRGRFGVTCEEFRTCILEKLVELGGGHKVQIARLIKEKFLWATCEICGQKFHYNAKWDSLEMVEMYECDAYIMKTALE